MMLPKKATMPGPRLAATEVVIDNGKKGKVKNPQANEHKPPIKAIPSNLSILFNLKGICLINYNLSYLA